MGKYSMEGIAYGVLNAVVTVVLYKLFGPEIALANVAYLVTANGHAYAKVS